MMTARCAYTLILVQLTSTAVDGTTLVLHSVYWQTIKVGSCALLIDHCQLLLNFPNYMLNSPDYIVGIP